MKNFQQNLLIVLALGLCAMCAWQWTDQAAERRAIVERNQVIYEREKAIQGYTNSLASGDRQIADMQKRIEQLEGAAQSDSDLIAGQKRDIERLRSDANTYSNEIVQYQTAVTNLEGKLTTAYDGIAKQNDAVKALIAERDDFIAKYTNSVGARNEIVLKYNALVERVNRMQSNAAAVEQH